MTGWSARGLEWKARGLLALGLGMMLAVVASGASGHGPTGFAFAAVGLVVARLMAKPWLVVRAGAPGGARALSWDIGGQVLLALVLFWFGVALAVFTGWAPGLPVWGPVFCILLAAWVSRMIWRPIPPEMDSVLDDATATLTQMAAGAPDDDPDDDARADAAVVAMMAALDALPKTGVRHHTLGDVVLPPMVDMPFWTYANILFDRARAHETDRDIRALVIGLTDPFIATKAEGEQHLAAAFDLVAAQGGAAALYCFEMQSLALLDMFPDAWRDMPPPERLRGFADTLEGDIADRYRDLAARVETLQHKALTT